jgi:hypothetical protein
MTDRKPPPFTFEDAERAQLLDGLRLSTAARVDFFEEMIELAYHSGALTPQRLALRDAGKCAGGDSEPER